MFVNRKIEILFFILETSMGLKAVDVKLNGRCTVFGNSLRSLFNSAFHSCAMMPKSHVNGRLLRGICFFDLIVLAFM